jgi:hypothetical protein
MEKHETVTVTANDTLPRPIVLRPEDLAAVAGASGGTLMPVASRINPNVVRPGGTINSEFLAQV